MNFFEQVIGSALSPVTSGIQNLTNPSNLGNLGNMYIQSKIMGGLGMDQQAAMQDRMMRNYISDQFLGGGIGSLAGASPIDQRTGRTFDALASNPNKEAIKKSYGFGGVDDVELMKRYKRLYNDDGTLKTTEGFFTKKKRVKLKPEDINLMMLIEALAMPKDIIREGKSDYQRREDQARADVQKQFGGRFQTYDTGSIYPQYAPRKGYAKGGIAGFAKGGESFPDLNNDGELTYADILKGRGVDLRNGGEASGPGTGTSDSIPARLSDGEFVMTAKAVRGMGDGDRAEGVRKMYALMNELQGEA